MAEPATDFTLDSAALLAAEEHEVPIVGRSPTYLAWRRLRRNYVALFSLFVVVVVLACCAPASASAPTIANTGPNEIHATEYVRVSGKDWQVIGGGAVYDTQTNQFVIHGVKVLGPTWWHASGKFVLGSDALGRDVAVRLLYGGLNSLKIGIGSARIRTL